MTNDDGGAVPAAPPPPVYPAYGPPGYPPPPGHPPGYGTAPAYPPYPGYPPPVGPPPALKPGIIPLRPLGLSDILNAAFAYIRVNPKTTLGFTTIVVVITQVIVLFLTVVVPLIVYGQADFAEVDDESVNVILGEFGSVLAAAMTTALSGVVLSGMLTVVVGRAVFGAPITIGEAWERMRGRLLALLGLTALEAAGAVALIVVPVFVIAVGAAVAPVLGVLVGFPLIVGVVAAFGYLWTILSFAPALIVLERLPVFAAIGRAFALVRGSFWRVFGIRVLGVLVAELVASAVAIPFVIGGELLGPGPGASVGVTLAAAALLAVGGAIGQIITAPFTAGVVVLLYMDRRIRAEAFDLVLYTGAAAGTDSSADSTDHLWLIRHP